MRARHPDINTARTTRKLARLGATVLTAGLVALLVQPSATRADSWPSDPTNPASPATVAIDRLPTVQMNGVAWHQVVHGDTVYVAGRFTTARPAGAAPNTQTVVRNNILAYDLETGALRPGFTASLNSQALGLAMSPDGSRLYVVGDFTTVNGTTRGRAAALNPTTGALIGSFDPRPNGSVRAVVATDTTVWLGGTFTAVDSISRGRLASIRASDGAVLPWTGSAQGGRVNALALSPAADKLVVGGAFTTLNASNRPGYGLGSLDPTTGALQLPFPANNTVRNGGPDSAILSLSSDATNFYGTGYIYGTGGNLEGAFSARWSDGGIQWVEDCHGDSYGVYSSSTAVYVAGHPHYCLNLGGYPEMPPRTSQRALAFSRAATGTLTRDTRGYPSFTGVAAPTLLNFFPQMTQGQITGQSQAAWTVSGSGKYVVFGGEFRHINGTPQQGLVRMATRDLAPNLQGPKASAANFTPTLSSPSAGRVRVDWPENFDYDNSNLTYAVLRDAQATPVHTVTSPSIWWDRDTLTFTDTNVPGGTHRYRVRATDPFGNSTLSPEVEITITGTGNSPPTARFTSTLTDHTLDVDAGGSTDTDGTIETYTWDWGDGEAGSGEVTDHVYTADGTYTVRLTVVDDDGSSGTTTQSVTVGDPPTVVASDTFGRTVSSGLGQADTGGAWTLGGSAARFNVNGGEAVVNIPTAGAGPSAFLGDTSSSSIDLASAIRLDKIPDGGGAFVGTIGRRVGAESYRLKAKVVSSGAVTLYAVRVSNGETTLRSVVVPGLTYVAGNRLNTRLQVTGTSPTTVRARVWVGATEPTTWQVSATDSTAGLQNPGSVGLHTYVSGTSTNAPWTVRFDDFVASPLP